MISFTDASGVAGMRPKSGARGPSSLPSRHALTVRINSAQRSNLMSPLCRSQLILARDFLESISSAVRPISRIRLMIKRKNGFFSYM
jgi:hypothetical protein